MELVTERLKIIPFTQEITQAAMRQDDEELSRLGVVPTKEWPEPDLVEALPYFDEQLKANGVTGFNSWLILDRQTNGIVGSLGFIGEPDEAGKVEIGFGIIPSRRRRGFCEEAVRALIEWAGGKAEVKAITAQCDADNEGSRKLLQKLGFEEKGRGDSTLKWVYVGPEQAPAVR